MINAISYQLSNLLLPEMTSLVASTTGMMLAILLAVQAFKFVKNVLE
jgi:hypothetical protein